MKVIKSDGSKESFDWKKIEQYYDRVSFGFEESCPYSALEENLKTYIVDEMPTHEINKMIIKSAIDLISPQNTDWNYIAGRFTIKNLYKRWSRSSGLPVTEVYNKDYLLKLMSAYTKEGLYNKKLLETYSIQDINQLASEINDKYDMDYTRGTAIMYEKRYLLNRNDKIQELPQHMYLLNAMFLGIPEPEETRLKFVSDLYHMTASAKISLPTPTLLNARTSNSQLSSCFILTPADDLRSIYHNIANMAQISKNGGGLGVYLGNIRAKGSTIKGVYGLGGGVTPWVKVINDTGIAVNQMGKRAGAISVTLDIFHKDIFHFLDLQTETGDIRAKSFDVFPAVSFPDLFMKRVEEEGEWHLFCPKEVEDKYGKRLQDHFGEDFEKFYTELEQDTDLKLKEKVDALELFKRFLKVTVETGMPYSFFRDTVNKLNPNKHAGNIYCSNLCTEIAQNQSENTFILEESEDNVMTVKYQMGDTVVCNLASINVGRVNDKETIEKVVPVVMRALDNVITLNAHPLEETKVSSEKYRAVGLGFMGLAQYFADNKMVYGSEESVQATDDLFEQFAYNTLKSSVDLAEERGHYPAFPGSEFSKGIAYGKDISEFDDRAPEGGDLGYSIKWKSLKERMIKHGTRFGYHSAPAPNTSTATVVGTTAGLLPVYKKYFIETNSVAPVVITAPNLNAENFWFYKDYIDMDMSSIIDVISTAQKWIDQSVSFEWLINPQKVSPKDLYKHFMKAWKSELKTIYYIRSLSLEVEDCVSCSG